MKSPKDMLIIQIDITNACIHSCSNCTRFCGHHKKPFFMKYDEFKRAVDSLKDFPGMVGIIGGEPTLHPEFEKFTAYLKEQRVGDKIQVIRDPIEDMQTYINENLCRNDTRAGLWSSLNEGYYKHFESINDTFETQFLNDHDNECLHQALLMPRKELGITDNEWLEKREHCWVQNTWSAAITPKGAFFCEVAASLDMLLQGPGGWEVTDDWWKRTPDDFGEQLSLCEYCSACIDVPQRLSSDERDDITPGMEKKLKELGSPKIKKGMYVVHDPKEFDKSKYKTFTGNNDYMNAGGNKRISKRNRHIYPKQFVLTEEIRLKEVLSGNANDWVIVGGNDAERMEAKGYFEEKIINPGCIYIYKDVLCFNVRASAISSAISSGKIECMDDLWHRYRLDKVRRITPEKRHNKRMEFTDVDLLSDGSMIVIYGAGKNGQELFLKLIHEKRLKITGWVDKSYADIGFPIVSPENIMGMDCDYILITPQKEDIYKEIKAELLTAGIPEEKLIWMPKRVVDDGDENNV